MIMIGQLKTIIFRERKHWNDYKLIFQSQRISCMAKFGGKTINYGTMSVSLSFKQKYTYSFQINTFYNINTELNNGYKVFINSGIEGNGSLLLAL